MTQIITLGGNGPSYSGYPIDRFFPRGSVRNYNRPWPFGFTRRWCDRLASSIRTPTVLIGFSAGASAALLVAARSQWVTHCFAHSPRDRGDVPRRECRYELLITDDDSTPGSDQVFDVAMQISGSGATWDFRFLPFIPFDNPTRLEAGPLTRTRHQFHNCLPFLKSHSATAGIWR